MREQGTGLVLILTMIFLTAVVGCAGKSTTPADQTAPQGVDPAVYAQLRNELQDILSDPDRASSAVGDPEATAVRLIWDEANGELSWYYSNTGDYDQNGEVNNGDLTPLGLNFGAVAPAQGGILGQVDGAAGLPFGTGNALSVVDGDSNGELNISDVTPLGTSYGRLVTGYKVYASSNPADYPPDPGSVSTVQPIADLTLADAAGAPSSDRLAFTYNVQSPDPGDSYWVRPVVMGAEGAPSNIAGPPLNIDPGQLAFVGIEPASAEPGQLITLKFSGAVEAHMPDLTVQVGDLGEISIAGQPFQASKVLTTAPLLPAGPVELVVLSDGLEIGHAVLTLTVPIPERSLPQVEQELADVRSSVDALLEFQLTMFAGSPGFDEVAAQADIDELAEILSDFQDWIAEEFAGLSEEDRKLGIAYLENTGYFEVLGLLNEAAGKVTSKSTSQLSGRNFDFYEMDVLSAKITQYEMGLDLGGLGLVALSLLGGPGTAVPVGLGVVGVKVFKAVLDGVIDTFMTTDLVDIRLVRGNRNLVAGEKTEVEFEGRFCAENLKTVGTVSVLIDIALNAAPIVGSLAAPAKQLIKVQILSDLESKLGEKLYKTLMETVLAVEDPDDPCYGKVDGGWVTLDLRLYEARDFDEMYQIYLDGAGQWWDSYPDGLMELSVTVADIWLTPDFVYTGPTSDWINISEDGKYTVELNLYRQEAVAGTIWSDTRTVPVRRKFDFYVGRYGDWRTETVATGLNVHVSGVKFAQNLDGHPAVLLSDNNGIDLFRGSVDGRSWSNPLRVDESSPLGFEIVQGLPTVLYHSSTPFGADPEVFLLQSDNAGGTGWTVDWARVPKVNRLDGTHTGPASDHILVDDSTDFNAAGVDGSDWWVELKESGSIARVSSLGPDGHTLYAYLQDGETFTPGAEYQVYYNNSHYITAGKPTLGVVGGLPSLLYWDKTSTLNFCLAMDVEGLDWEEPVAIGEETGDISSPVVVDGNPAYFSRDYGTGLYYRRSSDPQGENWGPRYQVVNPDIPGAVYCVTGGLPAVCYTKLVPIEDPEAPVTYFVELYFRLASNADGSSWGEPMLLYSGSPNSSSNDIYVREMEVINGVPVVAFECGGLKVLRATDGAGSEWQPVEWVAGIPYGSFGLISVDMEPVIFYEVSAGVMFTTPEL